MSKGWIKLHRAIEEHPRFKDAKWLQVWIKCLVLATHQPYKTVFDGKVIELQPGQFITSRKSLAAETRTHESKVERILKTLQIEHQIEQVGGSVSRLITITKWADFQDGEQDSEQQANNDRTTSEQRPNTNKNIKNKRTGRINPKTILDHVEPGNLPPAKPEPDNLQATKALLKESAALSRLEDPGFAEAWTAFLEMRRSIKKAATPYAQTLLLKKLEAYPLETAIAMVNESITGSYQGVFPLKEKNGTGKQHSGGYESAAQRNARKLRENIGARQADEDHPESDHRFLPVFPTGATGGGPIGP